MSTYKMVEIVGTSKKSYEDAIEGAVEKASSSLHGMSWFEVMEQHGKITDGKVSEFQAVIKVGFKLDD